MTIRTAILSGYHFMLVVWDTHTGVVIKEFDIEGSEVVAFHGDQRKITSVTHQLDFHTYDVFSGTQLCQGQISPLRHSQLGAHWAHNDTLQFATSLKFNEKHVINIHELQPTSTCPLHLLSQFPVPPQFRGFSFSPVSFHASFTTYDKVVILSTQSSKIISHIKVALEPHLPGKFSPNGCFFAYGVSWDEIHIWQNMPTGYVPWSNLRPRLSYHTFLQSPTSTSILCLGEGGMQLLHPDNCASSMPPNKVKSNMDGKHLVAISADQTYIVTTRKYTSIVTVLDCLLGTPQQPINTDTQIQDIKIIDDTIFVVDNHTLSSWDLKSGRARERVALNEVLVTGTNFLLSHDCSQIIFTGKDLLFNGEEKIFLYNIMASRVTTGITIEASSRICDLQLPPNQYGLWLVETPPWFSPNNSPNLMKLELGDEVFGNVTTEHVRDKWSWVNLFSPHGYHIGESSGWVTDPRGSKLLWLPPNWRVNDWQDARWSGNFLALVNFYHPEPMIIEFLP